jgi:hypothetical protein
MYVSVCRGGDCFFDPRQDLSDGITIHDMRSLLSTDILMRLYQYGEIPCGPISKCVKKKLLMFQLYDQKYQGDFL